jgi:UDP-glucose:(heptosyl)LPS alpha-1,3-glucosyltransferase
VKIALNHTRFSPAGGAENYVLRLVSHLCARGDEVHLFGRTARGVQGERVRFRRVRCVPFPQELRILTFAYRSARLIRAEDFDLTIGFGRTFGHDLHRDSSGTLRAFADALGPHFARSRLYRRVTLHLERRLYTDPDLRAVFAVSDFVKRQIQRTYPIPEARIAVLYNGVAKDDSPRADAATVRAETRRAARANGDRLVALFVGNDWRRKGLDCAIDGIGRTRAAWELWVVGEDKHADAFRRSLPVGAGDRVKFLGPRPAAPVFAAADALLFPSRFDPLANVVIEAMAHGLPVIVSPNDGAAEVVDAGGLVLRNPADGVEIAAHLDTLANPAARAAMRERAATAVAPLTWERHFAQLDELIARVAREKAALHDAPAKAREFEPA